MNTEESTGILCKCQIHGLPGMSEEKERVVVRGSLRKRLKLLIHRWLSPRQKRTIKKYAVQMYDRFLRIVHKHEVSQKMPTISVDTSLKAGDLVRVRTKEEIQKTLNLLGELKGCGFMKEMWPYCATTQRILKPVNRFLDERDYQIKKTKGIFLLEGVMCEGTEFFGPCDRACFFFWREEWLEKID